MALTKEIKSKSAKIAIWQIAEEIDELKELLKDNSIIEQIEAAIGHGKRKSKNSSIVLVQEHAVEGGAQAVAKMMEAEHPEFSTRVTILGHLQRGGSPTANDRILASRMGIAAVQALLEDQRNVMVGVKNGEIDYVPLSKAIKQKKDIKDEKWEAIQVLSI